MFENGASFIGIAVFGDDGVVHDAEGDVVDDVVGDFLFDGRSCVSRYMHYASTIDLSDYSLRWSKVFFLGKS